MLRTSKVEVLLTTACSEIITRWGILRILKHLWHSWFDNSYWTFMHWGVLHLCTILDDLLLFVVHLVVAVYELIRLKLLIIR